MSDPEHAGSPNEPEEERPGIAEPERTGGVPPVDRLAPPDEDGGAVDHSPTRLIGPRSGGGARTRRTVGPGEIDLTRGTTAMDRLYLLDRWTRSGLPATDFGRLVGMGSHTLYE